MSYIPQIPSFAWTLGFIAVVLVGAVLVARCFLVNVKAKEIAIKERRYLGKRMSSGRVVATKGEVGIQADVLKPGLHLVFWPFERIVQFEPLVSIGSDEVGVIEAVDGKPLPAGRIFAPDEANNAHDNFQDPIKFLTQGGVKGIQMRTLAPGLWPIHPYLFRVSICKQTRVEQGYVGVVSAADGASLESGRLLGRSTQGHNHFQDAEGFISNQGQKGPQVEALTPGTYRILRESIDKEGNKKPGLFNVVDVKATVVDNDCVGLVEALDGQVMTQNDFVAKSVAGHSNFQDGQAFLDAQGQRGPQKEILRPGTYYINTLLFKVEFDSAKVVQPGEVAVIVSNEGRDPTEEIKIEMDRERQDRIDSLKREHSGPVDADAEAEVGLSGDPSDKRLEKGNREGYVVPEGFRGIQKTVVGPGRYYVNTKAVTPYPIPTTNQTVEWTETDDKTTFDPFEVISKDGFKMKLEVRVVFRVKPEDAPFMVAKIGNMENLKQKVMHPTIDSIFRNQASESSAMAYLQNRHEEQEKAEAKVRAHLLRYHVDVVNVLICHIHLPDELMTTQTEKIIAEQRESMYGAKQKAEQKRIELEKITAQADKQKDLMAATVGVEIAEREADARQKKAAGEASYIQQTGEAEARVTELKGKAQGAAYREQVDAMGQSGVALVTAIKSLAESGTRITPDVVAGGNGESGGIGGALLGLLVSNMNKESRGSNEANSADKK